MDIQMPSTPKSEPFFNGRTVFFIIFSLALFAALAALIITRSPASLRGAARSAMSVEQLREYANRLKTDGLVDQAEKAYEEYLASAPVDGRVQAHIYFSIGEMLLDANRYEDALAYFYKAETADPNTDLKTEIGNHVVTCLERLGKSLDADYQLESRTALPGAEGTQKAPGDVVARIGIRDITMGEVNAEIEKLPGWVKEQIAKDESKKLRFLEQYVAHELIYDKGLKLGLHKDPEIREKIRDINKQLVIQRVISEEITDKIKIDPADVKNYFESHKSNYREPARLKFKHIQLESEEKAKEIEARLAAGESFKDLAAAESKDETTKVSGGEISDWVNEESELPGIGYDETFNKALFSLGAGGAPVIIPSSKGFHVVQVLEKEDVREYSYEEAAQQVDYDYRVEKHERAGQELIAEMVKSKDVQIYADKFLPKGDAAESNHDASDAPTPTT